MGGVDTDDRVCLETGAVAPRSVAPDVLIRAESFNHIVQGLARGFVAGYRLSPRLVALFATQQRWLLCHAALAEYYEAVASGRSGFSRLGFVQRAQQYGIASRNTTLAFFDEALKYGIVRFSADDVAAFAPSPEALSLLAEWYRGHLHALDYLDRGDRCLRFLGNPEALLAAMQPRLTQALLSSPEVRSPCPLYTLFAWTDAGGLVMDRLIAGIDWTAAQNDGQLLTDIHAIAHLAEAFGLSRPHASRKLAAAEHAGGLGWSGRRGRSRIWISRDFYDAYARMQAYRLAFLDAAFTQGLTRVCA